MDAEKSSCKKGYRRQKSSFELAGLGNFARIWLVAGEILNEEVLEVRQCNRSGKCNQCPQPSSVFGATLEQVWTSGVRIPPHTLSLPL